MSKIRDILIKKLRTVILGKNWSLLTFQGWDFHDYQRQIREKERGTRNGTQSRSSGFRNAFRGTAFLERVPIPFLKKVERVPGTPFLGKRSQSSVLSALPKSPKRPNYTIQNLIGSYFRTAVIEERIQWAIVS